MLFIFRGYVKVLNTTFNNISVILWWLVLLMEETTDLSQVTDKLYHMMLYQDIKFTSPEGGLNSQRQW